MSSQSHLFPISLKTVWKNASEYSINQNLLDWLLDPSSLTARLKTHCNVFRVEVIGQQIEECSLAEANSDIVVGEKVLVREVLLFCDEKPHVFARSLLPLRSLTGEQKKLAELGAQSLGQVLFNHPELIRKRIEISFFDQHSEISRLMASLSLNEKTPLWGRRSVFVLQNKPIMVAEVFLPGSFAYTSDTEFLLDQTHSL